MENYQLIFKRIFSISNQILDEYLNLLNLEKSGKKNSPEYTATYNKLCNLLEQEKSYYEVISKDSEVARSLLQKISYFNKKSIDFIIPQNNSSLIYSRMSLKLGDILKDLNERKSLQIFVLFEKMDLYSLVHYENILLALILFSRFTTTLEDSVFSNILLTNIYLYSFMFPYIENLILSNQFLLPKELYSSSNYLASINNVSAEELDKQRNRKFQQVENYITKNSIAFYNYMFLIFYLKALKIDEKLDLKDIVQKLGEFGIEKSIQKEMLQSLNNTDQSGIIRRLSLIV